MATVKKSITITDKHADFIRSQIASGDFATDSEVIRDALHWKQAKLEEVAVLREALDAARASGISPKTPDRILPDIKAKMRDEGLL